MHRWGHNRKHVWTYIRACVDAAGVQEANQTTSTPLQPKHGHKNIWIRTRPLPHKLGYPQDKKKQGLDDPPVVSLTSSSSSWSLSVLSLKGCPKYTLAHKDEEQKGPLLKKGLFLHSDLTVCVFEAQKLAQSARVNHLTMRLGVRCGSLATRHRPQGALCLRQQGAAMAARCLREGLVAIARKPLVGNLSPKATLTSTRQQTRKPFHKHNRSWQTAWRSYTTSQTRACSNLAHTSQAKSRSCGARPLRHRQMEAQSPAIGFRTQVIFAQSSDDRRLEASSGCTCARNGNQLSRGLCEKGDVGSTERRPRQLSSSEMPLSPPPLELHPSIFERVPLENRTEATSGWPPMLDARSAFVHLCGGPASSPARFPIEAALVSRGPGAASHREGYP